jgi:hypothetical protein
MTVRKAANWALLFGVPFICVVLWWIGALRLIGSLIAIIWSGLGLFASALLTPEVAAAIAAICSAHAAYLSWRSQELSLKLSHAPDIIIEDWSRGRPDENGVEILKFEKLTNVGTAPAKNIQIVVQESEQTDKPPYLSSQPLVISYLGVGESRKIHGQLPILWKNVEGVWVGKPSIYLTIRIWFWDALNYRRITTNVLFIAKDPDDFPGIKYPNPGWDMPILYSAIMVPGVNLSVQTTRVDSARRLRFLERLSRLPVVSRYVRGKY